MHNIRNKIIELEYLKDYKREKNGVPKRVSFKTLTCLFSIYIHFIRNSSKTEKIIHSDYI